MVLGWVSGVLFGIAWCSSSSTNELMARRKQMMQYRRHCIHVDTEFVGAGLLGVEYCCLCGERHVQKYKETNEGHGSYLRRLVRVQIDEFSPNCPNGKLEPTIESIPY